jgi:hypothetical protein
MPRWTSWLRPETSMARPRPGTYASPSQHPMSGLLPPRRVSWTPPLSPAHPLAETYVNVAS